ncbi:hypothetical protein MAPG_05249 [Magnaporthiopsis poae ATCC 64411]|uniref:La domain-containing protein n=1 Tax=Magnaporthiopsis poae (strain ATCC 64411 / 73-15) TaxID=644358 RepID=A0A0C4DYW8_MAGP6|nr:hypothetical protein MAPG_05249 [Magnaporthiopsis poae ATCC 64411]
MSDEAPKVEVAVLDAAATVKAEEPTTNLPAASDAAAVKAEPEAVAAVEAAEETKAEPVKASEETKGELVEANEEGKTAAVEETEAKAVKDIKAEGAAEIKAEPVKDTAADTAEEATAEAASDSPKNGVKEETAEDASANSIDILKTTAQENENVAKNRKFDASLLPESTDPAEMRKQVEFYFGDSNISQDKFLWENTDGSKKPMSLKIIHKFKRMQRFKSYEQLVAALRESEALVIAGEPGEETVIRKVPYDPERGNKAAPRTVYVKGFGDEEPTTQIDLEKFFNSFGLEVESVRLRRTDKKLFKGSVYVEFKTKEDFTKFLELDPKPKWKDHDLKIMSKVDYCEEKNAQIRAGTLKPSAKRPFRAGAQSGRGRGGGKDSDKREGKDRRDNDQKRGFNNRGGRGGRGRGGRGRGRGGRGGGGGRGGHRDGDRDGHRNGAKEERKPNSCNDVKPTIHSSAPKKEANSNGKRPRDGEASGEAPAAKKVATGNV